MVQDKIDPQDTIMKEDYDYKQEKKQKKAQKASFRYSPLNLGTSKEGGSVVKHPELSAITSQILVK